MDPKGQDLDPQPQECHTLPSRDSTNNPAHNVTKVETRQEEVEHHHEQQRIAEEENKAHDTDDNAHRVTSSSSHHHAVRHTTSKTTTTTHHHQPEEENNNNGGVQRVTSSPTIRNTRARLGLRPAAPINEEEQIAQWQGLRWSRVRVALREPFSEFFGVVIMMVLGNASVAQVLLSEGQKDAPGGAGYGSYQSVNWG
jgi:aquaglyceroporin related protein